MRVSLTVLLRDPKSQGVRIVQKTIDLPFVPTVGMHFQDGTWKDAREVTHVTIECSPPPSEQASTQFEQVSVAVCEHHGDTSELFERIYKPCGWVSLG